MKSTLAAIYIYRSAYSFPWTIIFSADYTLTKTLKAESHRYCRRDGVHDASSQERLGHIQYATDAADLRVRGQAWYRRPCAEGVRVTVRGARAISTQCSPEPAPERPHYALAVLLPGTAIESISPSVRKPKDFG